MSPVYLLVFVLFLVGVFGLLTRRNLIKLIISVAVIEAAVNLFLVLAGYRQGGIAPIMTEQHPEVEAFAARAVDPFPQAMVLTSIVIGLSLLALMVGISLRLYHIYGTYDLDEIRRAAREEGR